MHGQASVFPAFFPIRPAGLMQHLVLSGGSGAHGGARRNAALPRHRTPDGVLMAAGQGLTRVVRDRTTLDLPPCPGRSGSVPRPNPHGLHPSPL